MTENKHGDSIETARTEVAVEAPAESQTVQMVEAPSESAETVILPGSGAGPVGGMIQTPPPGPVDE